jgi:mannose-1-phosphate guanylyltransferase/mannose-1-phosphate guanylyltransferase/mannose-6-phosphate isomerase
MILPVILSGGEGKRLWPLSRAERPKQFLALTGPETLLQQTARRLTDPALFAPPIVIGAMAHRFLIAEQLRAAGIDADAIVLEPVARNTAPAVAVGALMALARDPAALILVAPADHAIPDAEAFRATVRAAQPAADAGRFVLFGIEPTQAATGYGYIERGAAVGPGAHAVARFVEKPPEAVARALIEGGALWNSGIFLLPARAVVAELEALAPEVLGCARAALAAASADADFLRLDMAAFAAAPSISIDHALMEKTGNAAVVAAGFAWSDIGAWSAVWAAMARDADGNAAVGPVVLEAASDCLVYAEGPRVAAYGVKDLVIIATPDRVLVAPRSEDQQVRGLAERTEGGEA